jgi:hypothetical protein
VATDAALQFIRKEEIEAAGSRVWTDARDWSVSNQAQGFLLN